MIKIKDKKIFLIALIVLISIIIFPNYSFADDLQVIENIDDYKPSSQIENGNKFLQRTGIIVNAISTIGIIVSVISLTVIGIKYIFGSVEGKAEYKKAMVPYIVGLFMLTCTSVVILIVQSVVSG